MTDQELIDKVRKEYEDYKTIIFKDLHDWDYYGLYVRYELCEWLETSINEYGKVYKELIEFLKQQKEPLEYMAEAIYDREDNFWDDIGQTMCYTMQWEKEHGDNN